MRVRDAIKRVLALGLAGVLCASAIPTIVLAEQVAGPVTNAEVSETTETDSLDDMAKRVAEELSEQSDANDQLKALWDKLAAVSIASAGDDVESADEEAVDAAAMDALEGKPSTAKGVARAFVLVATELGQDAKESASDDGTKAMVLLSMENGDVALDVAAGKPQTYPWEEEPADDKAESANAGATDKTSEKAGEQSVVASDATGQTSAVSSDARATTQDSASAKVDAKDKTTDDTKDKKDDEAQLEAQAATKDSAPSVTYSVHCETYGDQPAVKDGEVAGTTGEFKRLEALYVSLEGAPAGSGVEYRSHMQTYGWGDWASNGALCGTTGEFKRLEAVQLRLTGALADAGWHIWYRVHAQTYGWQGWTCDGETAGTAGQFKRLEAIQIVLLPDGEQPGNIAGIVSSISEPFVGEEAVNAEAHVQTYGWLDTVGNGGVAGTSGESKRMEALHVWARGLRVPGGIEGNAHCAGIGWQGWRSGMIGTTGEFRRMEALQLRLTGEAASEYDLYYRAHVQGAGWLAWASEEEVAGSTGHFRRIEAVQVLLVDEGAAAPSDADSNYPFAEIAPLSVDYAVWQDSSAAPDSASDGGSAGIEGSGRRIETFSADLDGDTPGNIRYRASTQDAGWGAWLSNGEQVGDAGSGKRIEALEIALDGNAADIYDVWYRVYVAGYGWMGWAANGGSAGTEGLYRPIESVQVRLIPRPAGAPGSTYGSFMRAGVRFGLQSADGARDVVAFGGYQPSGSVQSRIQSEVSAIQARGYDVGFIMMDLSSYEGIAYNCDGVFYGASSIKAPYIASVVAMYPDAIARYQDNIQETLFYSWDWDYKQVYYGYGNDPMYRWCQDSGADVSIAESLPWANYSARDLALLWGHTYELYGQSAAAETLGTWCERPNISTIHDTLGGKYRTRSKAGWIADGGAIYPDVNGGGPLWDVSDDGGIVYADNGAYVIAIMSSIPADHNALNALTASIDAAHAEM